MRRLLSALSPILLSAAAILTIAAGPARAQSRDEQDVRALIDQYVQAANSTDPKLIQQNLANYSASGGPFYHPLVAVLGSTADVEAMTKQFLPQMSSHTFAVTSPITIRTDKYNAWAAFTWHAEVGFRDGTGGKFDGRSTIAFAREGKSWKIVHWHSSVPAPLPLTKTAQEAETQAILQTERGAWEAIKNKQPAALGNYFTADASVLLEDQAYRMSGRENLVRGLTAYLDNSDVRAYQILEPQVQLLGGTALLTYYFTETGVTAGKEYSAAGKVSVVFVKQDGGWRALHEHRSVTR